MFKPETVHTLIVVFLYSRSVIVFYYRLSFSYFSDCLFIILIVMIFGPSVSLSVYRACSFLICHLPRSNGQFVLVALKCTDFYDVLKAKFLAKHCQINAFLKRVCLASSSRIFYIRWLLIFSMRTYGVNQEFRFAEGVWLHRKGRQIRFFFSQKCPI